MSINETHPRDAVIESLGLRNHRGDFDNLEDDFDRLRALGVSGSVQSVLSDLYFGRGMNYPAIFVLDGPGAGQYRRIVQAHSRTELVLDSQFIGVVPHASLLQMVPMRGQVIMFRNFIADTGVLQFYGQAMESIVAEHRHERTDGFISIGTCEGTYDDFDRNCSTASCQFGVNLQLQFLDNTVTESNHMWIWNQKQSQGEGPWDWHHMYNEYSFVAVGRNVLKQVGRPHVAQSGVPTKSGGWLRWLWN